MLFCNGVCVSQPPLTECPELGQKPVRLLGINTWDVAVALTNFDWNLFNSIHEVKLLSDTAVIIKSTFE